MQKQLFILGLLCVFTHCSKPERCGEIYDKITRDGRYFFILDSNYSIDVSTNNDNASFLPDNRLSGEVSKSVYDNHAIGEEYCQ